MPISAPLRWTMLLLAGLSWPLLYSFKLGQVGPILMLLFVLGWRWLDRPVGLGATIGIGTLVKVQPALLGVWALLTGRPRAAAIAAVVVVAAVRRDPAARRRRRLVRLRRAAADGERAGDDAA